MAQQQETMNLELGIQEHEIFEDTVETIDDTARDLGLLNTINTATKVSKNGFDLTYMNIVYSYVKMPEANLAALQGELIWKNLQHHSFDQIMETITLDIQDKQPKLMTLACFDRMVPQVPNQHIINGIKKLLVLIDEGGVHQAAIATCQFPPARQNTWTTIGQLNAELRIINLDRNLPPLPLHKALMKQQDGNSGPLIVKGLMWEQFCDKSALGSTLSPAGLNKLLRFLTKACPKQFVKMRRNNSKRHLSILQPPPLCETEGYTNNSLMMTILRNKGEVNRRQMPVVPMPGTQQQPRGQSAQATSNDREGFSRRPATWHGDSNMQVTCESDSRSVVVTDDVFTEDEMEVDQTPVFNLNRRIEGRNFNEASREVERIREEFYEVARETTREKIERLKNKGVKTVEELQKELRKLKLDNIKDKNEKKKLNKDLDEAEANNKKYKKEIDKLRLDKEAMRIERDCNDRLLLKLEKDVYDKNERIELLEDQYKFLKTLHKEKGDMIEEQWDKMRKAAGSVEETEKGEKEKKKKSE